jgi:hypothetical protein
MLAALLGSACAGGVAGCPDDLPAQCPSPVPSYASAVRGLLDQACTSGCHQPGGVAADRPLGTHADVYRQRSAVLNQAYGCTMPPAGSAALTTAQRALLLGWLVCGAPDN